MIEQQLNKVITEDYEGFYLTDVFRYLGEQYDGAIQDKFKHFLIGQTLGEHNGKAVVYEWDIETFLEREALTESE